MPFQIEKTCQHTGSSVKHLESYPVIFCCLHAGLAWFFVLPSTYLSFPTPISTLCRKSSTRFAEICQNACRTKSVYLDADLGADYITDSKVS